MTYSVGSLIYHQLMLTAHKQRSGSHSLGAGSPTGWCLVFSLDYEK